MGLLYQGLERNVVELARGVGQVIHGHDVERLSGAKETTAIFFVR
jgi:hypothetical protein